MKAFPGSRQTEQGMDLRDYFAAEIMPALICATKQGINLGENYTDNNARYAKASYALADALMEARKK